MLQTMLSNGKRVSVVGIGGHYKHFEYGRFEETYGPVEQKEIESRAKLIEKAVASGITYFDSTWQNEVEMLAKTLEITGLRNKVHVNGMVLGSFSGSTGFAMSDRDYFNQYLDKRLSIMPGNYFDSFMINAIEEQYDYDRCAGLIKLLLERRSAGDIGMIGFSCHNHSIAREVADDFPEFEIIMTAYNFRNRCFEDVFKDYHGNASFVAMKPLVWAQYGIPFSVINNINNFKDRFGFEKDEDIAEKALRFSRAFPNLNVTLAAVNNERELDTLIAAGQGENTPEDIKKLRKYNNAIDLDGGILLFIGGLETGNLRTEYFCADNLCNILGIDKKTLTIQYDNRLEVIDEYKEKIYNVLRNTMK